MDVDIEVQVRVGGTEIDCLRKAKTVRASPVSAKRGVRDVECGGIDVLGFWLKCERMQSISE